MTRPAELTWPDGTPVDPDPDGLVPEDQMWLVNAVIPWTLPNRELANRIIERVRVF